MENSKNNNKNNSGTNKKMPRRAVFVSLFLLYVFVLVIAVLFNIFSGQSFSFKSLTTFFNIVFFLVVAVILIIAGFFLQKGYVIYRDLNAAMSSIKKRASYADLLNYLLKEKTGWRYGILSDAFDNYEQDIRSVRTSGGAPNVDIEDYINEEMLEDIIHVHFLNQVTGTMTGLGILGTFIGLSVGLNGFNLNGSSGEIMNSIQPLMDGIKVAFHTSIYGLIFSLGFGFIYKKFYYSFNESIDRFLACFRKYVVPASEDGSYKTSMKLMEEMISLMKRGNDNTERINKKLDSQATRLELISDQNNKRINELSLVQSSIDNMKYEITKLLKEQSVRLEVVNGDLIGQVSNMMNTILVPEMKGICTSVNAFAENTRKDQLEGLENIVNAFIAMMNQSLQGHFEELSKTIADTNSGQIASLESMKRIVDEVNSMALDMAGVNKAIEKASDSVLAYAVAVEDMQDEVNANLASLNVQAETSAEIMNEQKHYFESLHSSVDSAIDSFKKVADNSVAQATVISAINDKVAANISEKTESMNQTMQNMTQSMYAASERLGKASEVLSKDMETRIRATFEEIDKQLAECAKYFGETIKHMDDTAGKTKLSYDAVSEDIVNTFEIMKTRLEQYLEYTEKLRLTVLDRLEEQKKDDELLLDLFNESGSTE